MIPWQGRLLFMQHIPGKAHKYDMKMYKLAAINGFTWDYTTYTGEKESMSGVGHAQGIVMKLLDGLDGCYRTVVADNFYTSISLAKYLLEHNEATVLDQLKFLIKTLVGGKFMGLRAQLELK
jgi:hypothetical protein